MQQLTVPSVSAMQYLVLGVAYFTLILFLIGVVDLLIGLLGLIRSQELTDPNAVIRLLNTVLLLLIIVEVHRTLIAYARNEPVIQIVVGAAIISVARAVISFRISEFETADAALTAAAGFGILLVGLVIAYYAVRRAERETAAYRES